MEECQFRTIKQWYFPRLCYQSLAHLQLRNFILYLTAVDRFPPPPSVNFCKPMYSYRIHNIPWPRDRRIIARKCLLFVVCVLIISLLSVHSFFRRDYKHLFILHAISGFLLFCIIVFSCRSCFMHLITVVLLQLISSSVSSFSPNLGSRLCAVLVV